MDDRNVIKIGNPNGRIAVYCDREDAYELASHYMHPDTFGREILEAIAQAYPEEEELDR